MACLAWLSDACGWCSSIIFVHGSVGAEAPLLNAGPAEEPQQVLQLAAASDRRLVEVCPGAARYSEKGKGRDTVYSPSVWLLTHPVPRIISIMPLLS